MPGFTIENFYHRANKLRENFDQLLADLKEMYIDFIEYLEEKGYTRKTNEERIMEELIARLQIQQARFYFLQTLFERKYRRVFMHESEEGESSEETR